MFSQNVSSAVVDRLLCAAMVRSRANNMLSLGVAGRLSHFMVDRAALAPCADFVVNTIRSNYPDLNVPFHARWRHFMLGQKDLWQDIADRIPDSGQRLRAAFDLAIVSVLLDAGAGTQWRYQDCTGMVLSRSEGLAIASFRMFQAGFFSADPTDPYRVDASKLMRMTMMDIVNGFQVSDENPLVGVEGRTALLNALGQTVARNARIFGRKDEPRPGGLADFLLTRRRNGAISAPAILRAVLSHLGPLWPSRITLAGVALGDCWSHPALGGRGATTGLIPFHKLSQWLSYSLIEPLQAYGIHVTDIDGLTGLPEYRNGGLFLDLGVLKLLRAEDTGLTHAVNSLLVIEWRALTVALLDAIAPMVRARLNKSAAEFPLACVLEGGTWSAGRRIARSLRADGGPPLSILSDGTVF